MVDEAPAKQPTVWAVHDGKIGMASQVLGLVEALGWPFAEKVLKVRAPWRYLSSQLWLNPFSALDPAGALVTMIGFAAASGALNW